MSANRASVGYTALVKYNPQKTQQICNFLQQGVSRDEAAELSDVDRATFYRWMAEYATFATAVKKAETKCKLKNIQVIQQAGQRSWRAAAWWLERRYPKEFCLRITTDQTVTGRLSIMELAAELEGNKELENG